MRFKGSHIWLVLILPVFFFLFLGSKWVGRNAVGGAPGYLGAVSNRDFDIVINTVGVLEAARSHMISSTIKGDKGKIVHLIEDGCHVQQGAVLVKFDTSPFEEEIHQLESERLRLTAALDADRQALDWEKNQVEREITTAGYSLDVAKLEYEQLVQGDGPIKLTQLNSEVIKTEEELNKYASYVAELEKLQQEGYDYHTEIALAKEKLTDLEENMAAAQNNYDSYKNHVFPSLTEAAKAKIKNAEMEYSQTRNGSKYKIAKANSAMNETKGMLDSTDASLARARKELEKTVIAAPYSGIVVLYETFRDGQKRKPRVGDKVWENQSLLYLPDVSSMVVSTQVREIDLHKIFLGQLCSITVDAYPDASFEGEVLFIGALATDRFDDGQGEKYFDVSISLKGSDMRLRPGMTARTTLINEQLKAVLSVPVQAVFNEAGAKYCYLFNRGAYAKTEVSLGRQNEDFVEILSGLRDGDQVSLIKPPSDDVR